MQLQGVDVQFFWSTPPHLTVVCGNISEHSLFAIKSRHLLVRAEWPVMDISLMFMNFHQSKYVQAMAKLMVR